MEVLCIERETECSEKVCRDSDSLSCRSARGSSVSAIEKLHCSKSRSLTSSQGDPPVCMHGFNIGKAGGHNALVIHV